MVVLEILLWIIIIVLFLIGLIGVFFPFLPDTIPLWIGFVLYHFMLAEPGMGLSASFWWGMVAITILIFGADFFANAYFVKKYGGSQWSSIGAILGVIAGIFVFPPFGMLILPFLFVLAIEMGFYGKTGERAMKVAFGTLVAFLGSGLVKVFLQVLMIIWFFLVI